MIFDGALPPARDDDDVLDAGMDRLFYPILDNGLVHNGQHLFGLGLGGGEEAGAETRSGENGFSNFGQHNLSVWCSATHLAIHELCFFSRCDIYWVSGKKYINGIRDS